MVRSVLKKKLRATCMEMRAAALHARPVPQVRPGRSQNADGIESGMLKESPVFHRKHGVAQHLRDVVVTDGAALLARTVKQAGQQLRLNVGGVHCRAVIHRTDFLD